MTHEGCVCVPELRRARLAIVACHAGASTLDGLATPGTSTLDGIGTFGARQLRVAPDEALFVAAGDHADDLLRSVAAVVEPDEPDALVVDVSDGWAGYTLSGADAVDAFSFISPLEPPPPGGFVQGDVARVGAKVFAGSGGELTLLVPTYHVDHLRERLMRDAGAIEVNP